MQKDLLLKNAKIYMDGIFVDGAVGVKAGKIYEILKEVENENDYKEVIDVGGKILAPGMIESHMHIREPGRPDRGTFVTETMAAAAGGVTTILEHPIANPPQYNKEILKKRQDDAKDKCLVDYAFFGAAGAEFPDKIKEMGETGIVAFKSFLHKAPEGRDTEFIGLTMADDGEMYLGFREVAKTGKYIAVHCENNDIISALIKKYRAEGKTSPIYHCYSRPKYAETETVAKIISLSKDSGCRFIFVHTTTPEAMELLSREKKDGLDCYVETCPQYLFLTEDALNEFGPYAKCNPALRKKEDVDKLWKYVNDGTVDFIGSDHATYTVEEKERGREDIFKAPAGFIGVDLRLPLMLNAVNEGKLSLEKCIDLLSTNVAKAFGIYPQKGTISVGSDADFAIIDMDREFIVDKNENYSKARDIAKVYDGWKLKGRPICTIVRGKVVMKENLVKEEDKGWGQLIESYGKRYWDLGGKYDTWFYT